MTTQALARARKTKSKEMVTVVRSVNGKTLTEFCPGLRNRFRSYEDAYSTIARIATEAIKDLKTTRKTVGEVSTGVFA